MNSGVASTARQARTGLSTPPGITSRASANRCSDMAVLGAVSFANSVILFLSPHAIGASSAALAASLCRGALRRRREICLQGVDEPLDCVRFRDHLWLHAQLTRRRRG